LSHPQIQFSIDETDMDKAAVGEKTTIVFDALPDQTFTGKVTRIDPALESSGGYNVVTGLIQMDPVDESTNTTLLKGMTATVQLVQASAENVLLIPVQALHDLGDGTYSVFAVGSDGQLKMKVVEIGLQDAASVEIKSGLNVGDVVSTGTVQAK
jgi:multidrug efflux pump subunit AcrA (membrane-fusion protein)